MSQQGKFYFYAVMTFGSILSFLHDLEHYQTIAMMSDHCSDEELALLKINLDLTKIDQLQNSPVTNAGLGTRIASSLFKFTGPQVVLLYQTFEKAYHLISALDKLLHLIEGDFRKPADAKNWHKGMVTRHAYFKKYLLKNIPVKYREELLGIKPKEAATPRPVTNYLYIHTLDGFPAYFDGRTIAVAGTDRNAKGSPHSRLRSLRREQDLAVNDICTSVSEAASQQFQQRLGYVIYIRPQRERKSL